MPTTSSCFVRARSPITDCVPHGGPGDMQPACGTSTRFRLMSTHVTRPIRRRHTAHAVTSRSHSSVDTTVGPGIAAVVRSTVRPVVRELRASVPAAGFTVNRPIEHRPISPSATAVTSEAGRSRRMWWPFRHHTAIRGHVRGSVRHRCLPVHDRSATPLRAGFNTTVAGAVHATSGGQVSGPSPLH